MTKTDERSIDARISELQALARNCSDRMMRASLNPSRQTVAPVVSSPVEPVVAQPAPRAAAHAVPASYADEFALRPSFLPQEPVSAPQTSRAVDPYCPDFLWREAHGRYAPVAPAALPPYAAVAGEMPFAVNDQPWHKAPFFKASLLPHFTYVGRTAAVILIAGTMALFLVTWKNSPVSAVVTSEDAAMSQAVQGGYISSDAIPSRKVALEKIVVNPEDNGFTGLEKPVQANTAAAEEHEKAQNKLVKTITLAGLTPGQFIDKSWPIPGVEGAESAYITQVKVEQPAVELAQVEATGANNYLARGEMLLRTGDIASARLMFRKASEMGDARGAIGIASTYDPNVLRTLPVYGMQGNAKMARDWYEKAKGLGAASEATARLEALSRL